MTGISLVGIIGTDNVVPVYDPTGRWTIWEKGELFDGTIGAGRYIPKVGDWVIDKDLYIVYIVQSLDSITLIPNLVEKKPTGVSYVLSEIDILLGADVRSTDTYRIYLDKSVVPYSLTIDKRCKVYGSTIVGYKVFRGSDLSENGNIISRKYASDGITLLGNLIDLELVAFNTHDNYAVKAPKGCKTLEDMPDGETVIVEFYDAVGHVVSRQQLIVVNTSFISQAYDEDRYIIDITLESAFIDPSSDSILRFPLNIPVSSLNLFGKVHYSDGSSLSLPIDGTKFTLLGMDQFISSIIGQRIDLVLSYKLSDGEATYMATSGDGLYITKPYSFMTVEADYSYTVKILGYPEWIDSVNGYRMKWYLVNLDRNILFDVSPYVYYPEEGTGFNPLDYGTVQRLQIALKLSDVSGIFNDFIHTQMVDIILRGNPTIFETPWEMGEEVASAHLLYGSGLRARIDGINNQIFTVHSDIATQTEWLDRVYYRTYPLTNPDLENAVLVPTHFEVVYQGQSLRYQISEWQNNLSVNVAMTANENVYIRFLKETSTGDLILSIAGMMTID